MRGWFALALPLAAACTNWGALYVTSADSAASVADASEAAERTTIADQAMADASSSSEAIDCPAVGPLALWKFDGQGGPAAGTFIPDLACRKPDMPLAWDLERNAGTTAMAGGALHLDGGFLFADKPMSDELGLFLTLARSFSLELWLRAMHGEAGTIFATNGVRDPGRAFSIAQKDSQLHFAVRTTATDPLGEHFVKPAGAVAELVVPLPVDTRGPVHVVAMYSGSEHAARVYIDGVAMETVVHAPLDAPEPVPVWTPGKNQLGLGGSFDGTGWHGWLYLVAVHDTALSAAEVARLFQLGPAR
jgi:hypothetical protein